MKRRVSVATMRPSQATTVPWSPQAERRQRLSAWQLQEHPVTCTDANDETLLLQTALGCSGLHGTAVEPLVLEAFSGGLLEVARRPGEELQVLRERLKELRKKLLKANVDLRQVKELGEFCFFVLQSLTSAGPEFRAVCLDTARRAIASSWWDVIKEEAALSVPMSIRKYRVFRDLEPEKVSEPMLGFATHWFNQEFYRDDKMEKSFQYSYAKLISQRPYLQCIMIFIFLGLFVSINYISTEIEHRALSPGRLILADPTLMLGIGAMLKLTIQIIFFNEVDGEYHLYHSMSFVLAIVFGIVATLWLFLADFIFYFYSWLPPEGWGLLSILVVCGFLFATRFVHTFVVCVVVLGFALGCIFIFATTEEYTPAGQIIFGLIAALGVVIIAYMQEERYRNDFKLTLALTRALDRSDELLLNLVPDKVLRSFIQRGITTLAENYENVTIMFVDVVGFTELASVIPPLEVVQFLSTLFALLEEITASNRMEKIKTIGDAFMAAAGLPEPSEEHAKLAARAALQVLQEIATLRDPSGRPTRVRIGLHSGPCAGGVVGERKISFDVWGDTVNIASRMQTTAPVDTVQCSESTAFLLRDSFDIQFLGLKDIKGKGKMRTYIIKSEILPV